MLELLHFSGHIIIFALIFADCIYSHFFGCKSTTDISFCHYFARKIGVQNDNTLTYLALFDKYQTKFRSFFAANRLNQKKNAMPNKSQKTVRHGILYHILIKTVYLSPHRKDLYRVLSPLYSYGFPTSF